METTDIIALVCVGVAVGYVAYTLFLKAKKGGCGCGKSKDECCGGGKPADVSQPSGGCCCSGNSDTRSVHIAPAMPESKSDEKTEE